VFTGSAKLKRKQTA